MRNNVRRKCVQGPTGPPKRVYTGEEAFLNFVHPLEEYSGSIWKESSPLQVAIMSCISSMGGSASEISILEFIKSKWDIINKYSRRGVLIEPSIRVVRLNCTVKRKGRHLFILNPDKPHEWMLNTKMRKNCKYQPQSVESSPNISDIIENEEKKNKNIEIPNEDIPIPHYMFEDHVLEYMKNIGHPVNFSEISDSLKFRSKEPGTFSRLPYERRLRAVLISMKCEGRVYNEPNTNDWVFEF